jgi:hypothetical protein
LPLVDLPEKPSVLVLGYEPEFDPARGLWFVDVALDPGTAFWPFVRLAVARYQPDSLSDLHLSPVVTCDFMQLPPERTATLSRPDDRHARVVVTGPVGGSRLRGDVVPGPDLAAAMDAERLLRARLERFNTTVGTDLAWQTVATTTLPVLDTAGTVVSWSGEVQLPSPLAPTRPGKDPTWRITVEEWETLPADPDPSGTPGSQARLVYADHLLL